MKRLKTALISRRKAICVLVSATLTAALMITPIMAQGLISTKTIISAGVTSPTGNTLAPFSKVYRSQFIHLAKRSPVKKPAPITTPTPTATPTTTPIPSITPLPSTGGTVEATVRPNYVLPVPTQYPEKQNTRVFCDSIDLTTAYPNNSTSFKVYLVDNLGNPIVGKIVSWNWDPDLGGKTEERVSAITDSDGATIFTITQDFDANNTYVEWMKYINLYFDGDENFNASVAQQKVIVSNNGLRAD